MRKLMFFLLTAALAVCVVSCEKNNKPGNEDPGNNDKPESLVPEKAVDLGIVLPRLDKEGNPLKDENGNEITYKLYWALSNLCESGLCANPEDQGDYYAWGETELYYNSESQSFWKTGKSAGYDWASYKWCNGTYNTLTKYCTSSSNGKVDNITELQRKENPNETMDDAVRATLGGRWRMPTNAEWFALKEHCTWTWATLNGVHGRLMAAPNGKSIFLPATGYRGKTSLNEVDAGGYYWSSSLDTDNPGNAYCLRFNSKAFDPNFFDSRCYGLSLRPVWEEE